MCGKLHLFNDFTKEFVSVRQSQISYKNKKPHRREVIMTENKKSNKKVVLGLVALAAVIAVFAGIFFAVRAKNITFADEAITTCALARYYAVTF